MVLARRSAKRFFLWLQLIALAGLSVGLMFLGHRTDRLIPLRSALATLLTPVQWMAALPADVAHSADSDFRSITTLRAENAKLRQQALTRSAALERYDALKAQNTRLRKLLGAAPRVSTRAIVASIVDVGSAPFARKLVVNRGRAAGVFLGQPVVDASGIMGQVSEVDRFTSKVILITDPDHAIPVEDVRSGQRALVVGTGASDQVKVPYLTASADIKAGDLLVSSGLGGIFPPGYPVAKVSVVHSDPNEAFLKILAQPAAHLNQGRKVLLIWLRSDAARPAS